MEAAPVAEAMARALVERGVDPNELAKSFTHLRSFVGRAGSDAAAREQAVDTWWIWLETLTGSGARSVVRSNQTRDYHVTILNACRTHLQDLDSDQILPALGWAVRLVRYYHAVPSALDEPSPFGERPPTTRRERPRTEEPRPAPQRPPKTLPVVGSVFVGKVLEVSGAGVVVAVPDYDEQEALGIIRTARLEGRQYAKGNSARVEVVSIRDIKGLAVVELKPGPKK